MKTFYQKNDKYFSTILLTLIEILKKYRLEHGLSQQKMADLLGFPRGRFQQWENGNANPKHEDSIIIEKFLSLGESMTSEAQPISYAVGG